MFVTSVGKNDSMTFGKKKASAYASLALAALLIIFFLFSMTFIVMEAHHDCEGEDCPICSVLKMAEDNIRSFHDPALGALVIAFIPVLQGVLLSLKAGMEPSNSLISEKIRLNI